MKITKIMLCLFFLLPLAIMIAQPSNSIISLGYDLKMVSGTEYLTGEEAQVIVRVADKNGNPVVGADCDLTLYKPNKSIHLTSKMDYSAAPGNYFHNFSAPDKAGIYEEYIHCTYAFKELSISSSFHVNPALNRIAQLTEDQQIRYLRTLEEFQKMNETLNKEIINLKGEIKKMELNYSNQLEIIRISFNELSDRMETTTSQLSDNLDGLGEQTASNDKDLRDKFSRLGLAIHEIFSDE
ncbi:hypothetical protein K9M79_06820 [Candidatus Woesearchaeota archaeon]|nr:hypothetical protein [Candidatus Woesearchaeota archaeon]